VKEKCQTKCGIALENIENVVKALYKKCRIAIVDYGKHCDGRNSVQKESTGTAPKLQNCNCGT
jgi:hypothetical protein